jgi:hypothetical protein
VLQASAAAPLYRNPIPWPDQDQLSQVELSQALLDDLSQEELIVPISARFYGEAPPPSRPPPLPPPDPLFDTDTVMPVALTSGFLDEDMPETTVAAALPTAAPEDLGEPLIEETPVLAFAEPSASVSAPATSATASVSTSAALKTTTTVQATTVAAKLNAAVTTASLWSY